MSQKIRNVSILPPDTKASPSRYKAEVWGVVMGERKLILSYYSDELSFSAEEFEGKTVDEALDLFHKRDIEYLRS